MPYKFELEKKMKELDNIILSLESEELTLAEQMKEYEKGILLIKECRNYLETTEQKIIDLSK